MTPADYLELVLLRQALTHTTKSAIAIRQMVRDMGQVFTDGQILAAQRKVRQLLDDYVRNMPDDEDDNEE